MALGTRLIDKFLTSSFDAALIYSFVFNPYMATDVF